MNEGVKWGQRCLKCGNGASVVMVKCGDGKGCPECIGTMSRAHVGVAHLGVDLMGVNCIQILR